MLKIYENFIACYKIKNKQIDDMVNLNAKVNILSYNG